MGGNTKGGIVELCSSTSGGWDGVRTLIGSKKIVFQTTAGRSKGKNSPKRGVGGKPPVISARNPRIRKN